MTLLIEESPVKSRERVKSYGEVFTPRHMVDQMLDLVTNELELHPGFVDKTFLEPAAGDGNFLVVILERKLRAIQTRFDPALWPQESLFALASIYGIELLADNHADAKAAMLDTFLDFHRENRTPCHNGTNLHRSAAFLIETNIIRGNTLTGLDAQGDPITFSWWNRMASDPSKVVREPFTFASLRDDSAFDFTVHDTYAACDIAHVHKELKRHG